MVMRAYPTVILASSIQKTYLPNVTFQFSTGSIKSCNLDVSRNIITLYESELNNTPAGLGLFLPSLFHLSNGVLTKIQNGLCPYTYLKSLKSVHGGRGMVSMTCANYKFTGFAPPTEFPDSPEGAGCRMWHSTNLEVINNTITFPQEILEKLNTLYLMVPSTALLQATRPHQRHQLIQLAYFSKLYSKDSMMNSIRQLTEADQTTVANIAHTSSINARELISYMPHGCMVMVIPSRIAYIITFNELTRLVINHLQFNR